ncbi:MAG TPA: apolipoprotein N-acyltransferase [bacterium]|nr:apolipoprotein N-acyltransferase [bacterium]
MEKPPKRTRAVIIDLLLLLASALIFTLSFPSFAYKWGFFPLAYLALIPVFLVVHRAGWLRTALYGTFFGYFSYVGYNYWLATFHPLTLAIVPPIYSIYFAFLFPLFKLADKLFPRYGYLLQTSIWVSFEFFKVQGFLGYAYGIIGYSQYPFRSLIGLAAVTGVWGISLLVVFPSAFLGNALKGGAASLVTDLKRQRPVLVGYLLVFAGVIVYGQLSMSRLDEARQWKVALVQQNVDPWKGGYSAYERSFSILTRLSTAAAREDPDIIIWSETSFVPAIDWHTRYRTDRTAYNLVKRLRDYLSSQEIPFVIGNDDGQMIKDEFGREVRVDYNATVLWDQGGIVQTYRKIHLVPFTESFPFRKTMPGIYKWLKEADTHFWEKGKEFTVFEAAGVKFSTPICFEDTFGYISRRFVNEGAEVLVNMTNDTWSNSIAAEMQHMTISLFRAVENKRTLLRATNGGITCVIDPNGRIIEMLEPFTEDTLIATVPVYTGQSTLYTRWGDWFAYVLLVISLAAVGAGVAGRLLKQKFGRRE